MGQHYPGLVRRLTAVVGDRESALDLAQEAYLRAHRAWDRFEGTDGRAWLYMLEVPGVTWASANGLDWVPHGQAPMESVEASGIACQEYPRTIAAAGPWLIASTDLSGPCSEGGFAVHGTQLISIDGATWRSLPFDVGTAGESRSGSSVSAALPGEGFLILAGEKDGEAAFWIGEAS